MSYTESSRSIVAYSTLIGGEEFFESAMECDRIRSIYLPEGDLVSFSTDKIKDWRMMISI